jgi:DinB superfamily
MTLEEEKQALIEAIDYVRDRLNALIDGVDPDVVIHPASGWRLRDVLAHIAAWQREAVAAGRAHIAGEPEIPRQYIPRFNQETYEAWKEVDPQEVRAALWAVYDDLKDMVRHAPDECWDVEFVNSWHSQGTLTQHVRAILSHDAEHVSEIWQALSE